jgi:hypothetical protein
MRLRRSFFDSQLILVLNIVTNCKYCSNTVLLFNRKKLPQTADVGSDIIFIPQWFKVSIGLV